jgi:hypothetical protein
VQSKVSRVNLFAMGELTSLSPIGHMRITPPGGGVVTGQYVPGNVSAPTVSSLSLLTILP